MSTISKNQWDMVLQYIEPQDHDRANALKKHLESIGFSMNPVGVEPSPFDNDFQTLVFRVRIGTYAFNFYASHHDARQWTGEAFTEKRIYLTEKMKAQNRILRESVYYVLVSIGCDLSTPDNFKDFYADYGYNDNSIKDQEVFHKCLLHAKSLKAQGLNL